MRRPSNKLFDALDGLEAPSRQERATCSATGSHRSRLAAVHHAWCASTRSISATSSATPRRIADYPNLSALSARSLPGTGVAETVNIGHIKTTITGATITINPHRHRARWARLSTSMQPHGQAMEEGPEENG